jgi:hypothetical protein
LDITGVNLVSELSRVSEPREWKLEGSLVRELEEKGVTVERGRPVVCAASALARIMI